MDFAQRTVQRIEFAGFGPCEATGRRSMQAQVAGRIVDLKWTASGVAIPFPPALMTQNRVDPEIQAVLSAIHALWLPEGVVSPLASGQHVPLARGCDGVTHVLWWHRFEASLRQRLVLAELYVHGLPVWHAVGHMPWNGQEAYFREDVLRTAVRRYLRWGKRPLGNPLEALEAWLGDGNPQENLGEADGSDLC